MSVYPTLKPTKVQHFYQFRLGLCTSFDRSLRSGKGLTPLETVLRGFAVAPQKTVQYCTLEQSAYCKFFSPLVHNIFFECEMKILCNFHFSSS